MSNNLFLLIIFITTFTLFINCETSTEPVTEGLPVNRKLVADCLGDHDGITTSTELETLNQYFVSNEEAWVVGSGLNQFEDEIPSDILQKNFLIDPPLFRNETELREHYKDVNIRTPFVGIYVLESHKQILVIKIFRAPGPNISNSVWKELQII